MTSVIGMGGTVGLVINWVGQFQTEYPPDT
jgi:hypothetical protein